MKSQIKPELSREMNLFQVTMMGVGMMIGAGVFVATGIGIGIAGPGGILLAFSLNGLMAFFSVMTYAELGSALPLAGGGYSYVQESSPGLPAFMTGWISWFGHAVAGSLYAITFSKYTLHFLVDFQPFLFLKDNLPLYERVVAVLLILVFLYINYRGARETGKAGAVIAIGQTLVLLVIALGGMGVLIRFPQRLSNFTPFFDEGWRKVFVVMGFSLIGFEGYEVIAHTAEEVVDAKRNVPRGIFCAVIIVVTTYLLVAAAAIVGGGFTQGSLTLWFKDMGATGFAEAVGNLFPLGGMLAVFAAVFASTSALNATIYSSTRISFSLGRDGYLPPIFERISEKTRIPHGSLFFSGAITLVVAALFDVEIVMAGASIFFIFLFNIVTFCGMKIRIERGHELEYGYIIPFFPVTPILSILGRTMVGIFLLDMALWAYIIAGIWLLFGLIYYILLPVRKKQAQDAVPYGEMDIPPKGQIQVALSNENNAEKLIRYGKIFAENSQRGIILSTVVTVPTQTPMDVADHFSKDARKLINRTAQSLGKIPHYKNINYAHNTAQALIHYANKHRPQLMILGWQGKGNYTYYGMGSNLDPVIEKASCDLVVIKPAREEPEYPVKRILCPTKGKGPHGKLAWELVKQLAQTFDAEVTIMHVTPGNRRGSIPERLRKEVQVEYDQYRYDIRIIQDSHPVKRIHREAQAYDMLVIGATEKTLFQRILFGFKAQQIARGCSCTVMMVRKNRGIRSWFKRWFI